LRVSLKDDTFTSILADDTKIMGELCQVVLERIGPENAIDLDVLIEQNDEENGTRSLSSSLCCCIYSFLFLFFIVLCIYYYSISISICFYSNTVIIIAVVVVIVIVIIIIIAVVIIIVIIIIIVVVCNAVDILEPKMTLRDQGYVGDCRVGLYKQIDEEDPTIEHYGLYIQLPYLEGYLYRKRGGGVRRGLGKWNKRWYVLKKNKLHHFKEQGHKKEKGNIQMRNVISVSRVSNPKKSDIPEKVKY
jgi:hypothetical protein